MAKLQFRVLYREFLFRMVDLELLSVQGDMNKLLGQFAAVLVLVSIGQALHVVSVLDSASHMPRAELLIRAWPVEHSLVTMTMLVVGLFAVLSWDSIFPSRRDVLVLAPLPIRARTFFLAKVAASATALSVTVAALNALPGFVLPVALAPLDNGGLLNLILSLVSLRSFAAHWITVLAAGAFVFCCVLGVQGLAAQLLPRRRFLRVSAFLQMAAFSLFLSLYLLEPSMTTPKALAAPENQRLLACLPSYWFLGLFQLLNGSMHPALAPPAHRALGGLAVAVFAAATAFLLSYFRTLRRIVEEPDILPGARRASWLPRFGRPLETAVVQFSIRTLLRSRQHRVILAFYWGIGFAIVILLAKTRFAQQAPQVNVSMLVSSIVMLCVAVLGTRVVFSMPLELRANWIFRMAPVRGGPEFLAATRRSLFVLAVIPVWAASATLFLSVWPWRSAIGHLIVLGLLAIIFADLCLLGFRKIPFTCSYLPGKSYAHMAIWAFVVLQILLSIGAEYERRALENPAAYVALLFILCAAACGIRWRASALANKPESELQFDEEPAPALQGLGLRRDGILPLS